jgi:hypothetical protein
VQVDDEGIGDGTAPQALVARRERVGDGNEGERVTFRRPLVLLVLARVAADLGEALVLEEPALPVCVWTPSNTRRPSASSFQPS